MKKTLTLVLSLALAVAIGIGGTLAWLTAQTSTITNTFTVGQVDITLQEKEIGKNTFLDAETEAKAQTYKVSPGVNIEKEAKVVVKANSEACYLFVKVVKGNSFDANFAYTIAAGWTELTEGSGIYYRTVDATNSDVSYEVLAENTITVKDSITTLDANATLSFQAYAIQSAGITGTESKTPVQVAWETVSAT